MRFNVQKVRFCDREFLSGHFKLGRKYAYLRFINVQKVRCSD